MARRRRRGHTPSAVATHRLAEAIRRNRAELENEVTEGLLRSEVYRHTGRPDVAAEVIEEQRNKIVAFEGRVRDALAAAAVEAEAEAVLAAADREVGTRGRVQHRAPWVPQLVAAAVAAIASLAVMTSVDAVRQADGLQAAVRIDSTDRTASPSDQPSRLAPIDGTDSFQGTAHRGSADGPTRADDVFTRRWLVEQEALLAALGMNIHVRVEVMRELEHLVSSLAPGGRLTDELLLEVLSGAALRPASSDEPADAGSSDDGTESESRDGAWIPTRGETDDDAAEPDEQPQEAPAPDADTADGQGSDGDAADGQDTTSSEDQDEDEDAGSESGHNGVLSRVSDGDG